MNREFKIGDRVSVSEHDFSFYGKKDVFYDGTIVDIPYPWHVSVEFDKYIGSNYEVKNAKFGYGAYINKKNLRLIKQILTVKEWKESLK